MNRLKTIVLLLIFMSTALSAQVISTSPVAYWDFDDAEEVIYDKVGNVACTWTEGTPEYENGMFGNAAKFAFNPHPYMKTASDPIKGCSSASISCWVNYYNLDNQYRGMISHNSTESQNWAFSKHADNHLDFRFNNNSMKSDEAVVTDHWYHIVMTWEKDGDNTHCKFYIDGVLQSNSQTIVADYADPANENAYWHFGEDRETTRRPRAYLDDVTMFNVTLTQEDVNTIHTEGRNGEPFQRAFLEEIALSDTLYSLFIGQKRTLSYTLSPVEASTSAGFTWESSDESVVTVDQNGMFECVGSGEAYVKVTFNGNTTIKDSCKIEVSVLNSEFRILPNAYWPMEDEQGVQNTVDVISGVKANVVDGSISWETAGFWQSPKFDYESGHLQTESNPIKGATEATVMAWVYFRQIDNQYRGLITMNTQSYGNWGFNKHTDNKIDARFNSQSMKSDNPVETNRWYHVAITWVENGADVDCKLYVDGVLQSSSSTVSGNYAIPLNDPAKWVFGTDRDTDRKNRALIDDIAMFDEALTLADIQQISDTERPLSLMLGLIGDLDPVTVNNSRVQYDYDLGLRWSPILEGFGGIFPETNGDISWSETPEAFDRGTQNTANVSNRDFVSSANAVTLSHKVENGAWQITMNMGDADNAISGTVVEAEGVELTAAGGLSSAADEYSYVNGTVTVTDGSLDITVSNANQAWAWNRLSLRRVDTEGMIGTLHTVDDEPIRAAPMTFAKSYPGPVAYALDVNNWLAFKDMHYNAIRVTWTGAFASMGNRDIWNEEEIIEKFGQVVATAEKAGMTAIINYHNVGEQDGRNPNGPDYEMELLEWFWNIIATHYGNNPRVMFELQNEPSFSFSGYTKPEFKNRFLEIYKMVRELAPETQLIVFSPSPFAWIDDLILNYYDDLDWDYTTAGYHLYSGTNSAPIQRAAELARAVCTEYDFNVNIPSYQYKVDGCEEPHQAMENIGQGWMDWGTHASPLLSHSYLVPDALEKGYNWWTDADVNVEWVNPLSESLICEGEDLEVSLNLSGSATIAEVNLYLNGDLIGSVTQAPYTWNGGLLDDLQKGDHVLRVEITDTEGAVKFDHLDLPVYSNESKNLKVVDATESAWVCVNGTQQGTSTFLTSYTGEYDDEETRSYIKFDLRESKIISFEDARLRIFNRSDSDDGYVIVHELLDDNWNAADVSYASGPKNQGYPGRVTEVIGDGNEAPQQFWKKDSWVIYDMSEFVQQQFADDSIITFMVSNLYDNVQNRFDNSYRSNLTYHYGSHSSDTPPQLVLSAVTKEKVPIDSVMIPTDSLAMFEGDQVQPGYVVFPMDATTDLGFVWTSSDESVVSVSGEVLTAEAEGTATVYISYDSEVLDSIAVTVSVRVGIEPSELVSEIKVYPNPASSKFIVESVNETIEELEILSVNGSLIQSVNCFGQETFVELDASSLNNGLYIIRLTLDNGEKLVRKLSINK